MEKRFSEGHWSFLAPLGYGLENGSPVPDVVLAPLVRELFQRWATGDYTAKNLSAEMASRGLLGRQGKPLATSQVVRILKNPFYAGSMVIKGIRYPSSHGAIVEPDLFDRARAVFVEKVKGRKARKHLDLLLTDKIVCPRCDTLLTGEHHRKPSGKVFRYYRCHALSCGFVLRAQDVEGEVGAVIQKHVTDAFGILAARQLLSTLQNDDMVAKRQLVQSLVGRVLIFEGDVPSLKVCFANFPERP